MSKTQGELQQEANNKLLSDDGRAELDRLNTIIEKVTLTIYVNLTHDDTGRYSDDGHKFNALGMEKQKQLLDAGNVIKRAMEVLSKL